MKKVLIIAGTIMAVPIFVCALLLGIGSLQRHQDALTLQKFVSKQETLSLLKGEDPSRENISCKVESGEIGKCTALLYRISKEECVLLEQSFKAAENDCNTKHSFIIDGRNIEIRLGEVYVYDGDGYTGNYVTVIMNESNLLWKQW
jgi:hypothetical protein